MDHAMLLGSHVLVIEDEMRIMIAIEDMFSDLGCTSITSVATVKDALALIQTEQFDLATLDLNLDGSPSYEVADALSKRGVPFAFSTGYGARGLSELYSAHPVLSKPYTMIQFTDVIGMLLGGSQQQPSHASA